MRLIDADKTIRDLAAMKSVYDSISLDGMIKGLEDAPTIDAVPVVRCRDCLNGELCVNLAGAEYVVCKLDEQSVSKPDNFCSYGERKDGGG